MGRVPSSGQRKQQNNSEGTKSGVSNAHIINSGLSASVKGSGPKNNASGVGPLSSGLLPLFNSGVLTVQTRGQIEPKALNNKYPKLKASNSGCEFTAEYIRNLRKMYGAGANTNMKSPSQDNHNKRINGMLQSQRGDKQVSMNVG